MRPVIAAAVGLGVLGVGALLVFAFSDQSKPAQPLSPENLVNPSIDGIQPASGPPKLIPLPSGWRRVKDSAEVPRESLSAASSFLYSSSMGQFADHGTWGLIKEYHQDDHVSPGVVKWHPGVTVLLPATVVA